MGKKKDRFTEEQLLAKKEESKKTILELISQGIGLIVITQHNTTCKDCIQYEGKTFAIVNEYSDIFPLLTEYPPFCKNCSHTLAPKVISIKSLERLRSKVRDETIVNASQKREADRKEKRREAMEALQKEKISLNLQVSCVNSEGKNEYKLIRNPEATKFLDKFMSENEFIDD